MFQFQAICPDDLVITNVQRTSKIPMSWLLVLLWKDLDVREQDILRSAFMIDHTVYASGNEQGRVLSVFLPLSVAWKVYDAAVALEKEGYDIIYVDVIDKHYRKLYRTMEGSDNA